MCRIAVTLAMAVLVQAGCATLVSKPLSPEVRLDGVRVAKLSPGDTRLAFRLVVTNPNGYDLVVNELDYTIAVLDLPLARGALDTRTVLPAGAETPVELELRTDFVRLSSVLERMSRTGVVRYEATGSALVQDGARLPFARRGEVDLAKLLERAR